MSSARQNDTIIADEPAGSIAAASDPESISVDNAEAERGEAVRLSYKFQRLREKLREAIASGELSGRLPGERQLARRFRVNAKTLSKALTDLAAEGLLDRSIGRGTFVRGSDATTTASSTKWLIICDEDQVGYRSIKLIQDANPGVFVSVGVPDQRPSFLNPFKAAVIYGRSVPDSFIRDLVVRNISVVVAGREPNTFSTHAVVVDRTHGVTCVARDLMLAGHRRFLAVEAQRQSHVASAIRLAASRYAPDATVEPLFPQDIKAGLEHGATAVICDSFKAADTVSATLERMGINVPAQVSLAVVGVGAGESRYSGYTVSPEAKASAILELLQNPQAKRPTTLWLAVAPVNANTTGPAPSVMGQGSDAHSAHASL